MSHRVVRRAAALAASFVVGAALSSVAYGAWEPTKPVTFVVPAGTGGGADQMARFLQGVIAKHKLMPQPMIVVNESGGAGSSMRPRTRPASSSAFT